MDNRLEKLRRDIELISQAAEPATFMEVCGTHTVSIFRNGIKSLLPDNVNLISGPGCPVCVTPQGYLDAAIEIARSPETVLCTYGDMMRVPGSEIGLEGQKARGSDIRVVISARDAVKVARENPGKKVIWLGVGFETTAPTTAAAVKAAKASGLENFFVLNGHKLAIPAMHALMVDDDVQVDGYLCPGHVSVIIGEEAYKPLVQQYSVPCVIAGFEPVSIMSAISMLLNQHLTRRSEVENTYTTAVPRKGNAHALGIMDEVFRTGDAMWRSLGTIPESGLHFRDEYAGFDAVTEFDVNPDVDYEMPGCRCGEVIQGKVTPAECGLFGDGCTPIQPVGPCMVSSEGTCAAWYKYGQNLEASRKRARG
jgi:hydrogenase expression/formation protein HypD